MARNFAKAFYHSRAWKVTREGYLNKVAGLCEDCLRDGLITPAEIVHHKIVLTPENITDVDVALNYQNLKAVCRQCHAREHETMYKSRSGARRYQISEDGSVLF